MFLLDAIDSNLYVEIHNAIQKSNRRRTFSIHCRQFFLGIRFTMFSTCGHLLYNHSTSFYFKVNKKRVLYKKVQVGKDFISRALSSGS